MSLGPLGGAMTGVTGSAAGSALSQKAGSAERASKDAAAQERGVEADLKTELASGIGQTEQDGEASDRDADGRRLWERPEDEPKDEASDEQPETNDAPDPDTDTDTGGRLDLVG